MQKPTLIKGSPSSSNVVKSSNLKRRKQIDDDDTDSSTNRKIKVDIKPTTTREAKNNGKLKEKEKEMDRADRAESSNSTAAQTGIMPKEMYQFCKTLMELEQEKKLSMSGRKGNVKFNQLLRDSEAFDEGIDIGSFQHSFTHYYRWATHPSEIPLTKAIQVVMDYIQSDQIVLRHPEYPKRPANQFTRFITATGQSLFKADTTTKEQYKNKEDPRVIKACEEYAKDKERYLNELREFTDNHQHELFQSQIEYLQKEIKKAQKAIEDESGKRKGQRPKPKQRPTAFDLYKNSKEHKYMHLQPAEREAKLRRHFDKLSEEQLEIYESIAATYPQSI